MTVSNLRLLSTFSSQRIHVCADRERVTAIPPVRGSDAACLPEQTHQPNIGQIFKNWTVFQRSFRIWTANSCSVLLCLCLSFRIKKNNNPHLIFLTPGIEAENVAGRPKHRDGCTKAIWLLFLNKTDLHWNWLSSRVTIPHPSLRMLLGKPARLACKPE